MGRNSRPIPTHLGAKLTTIRNRLGISQGKMLALVKPDEHKKNRALISEYENGEKVPDWVVLLAYARIGKVLLEALVDDSFTLDSLPVEIAARHGLDLNSADVNTRHTRSEKVNQTERSVSRFLKETPDTKNSLKRFVELDDELFFGDFLSDEDNINTTDIPEKMKQLEVWFDPEFLLDLDNLYLHLLRRCPLDLRGKLTRQYFRQLLVFSSVNEYINAPEISYLNAFWTKLTKFLSDDKKDLE